MLRAMHIHEEPWVAMWKQDYSYEGLQYLSLGGPRERGRSTHRLSPIAELLV